MQPCAWLLRSAGHSNWVCAGINVTVRLEEMVGLRGPGGSTPSGPPSAPAGVAFAALLDTDDAAFDELYVATFDALDREWLAAQASYMQFPMVLDATCTKVRAALECRPAGIPQLREALDLPLDDH